jgi:hypothetical protein
MLTLYSVSNVFSALSKEQTESVSNAIERRKMEVRYTNLPPLRSMFTFISFVTFFVIYAYFSPQDVMHTKTLLVCSTFGMVAAYLVSRVVLARVCDEQPPSLYMITLPLPLFTLYSLLHVYMPILVVDEGLMIMTYLIYVMALYAHFIYDIMNSISTHLGIFIFSNILINDRHLLFFSR